MSTPAHPGKPWTARRIHLWVSTVLAIPLLLIAASGILIGLRSVGTWRVPASWMAAESVPANLPMSAYAEAPDGSLWIGNMQGLTRVEGSSTQTIAQFSGQEIVGLAFAGDNPRPVVATRMAVWIPMPKGWKPELRGRVRQLFRLSDDRAFVIVGGLGELADGKPMVSANGVQWQPYEKANLANAALPPLQSPTVPVQQWARELHSGAYFFGKGPGEIGWNTVFGIVLGLLCLTGLWVWLKNERQKAGRHQTHKAMPREASTHD